MNELTMRPLITGSLAYDYLMHIGGRFTDRWPVQPNGDFAAAYVAPSLKRTFGGCAANIAYALQRLGDAPLLMTTAGEDFTLYRDYLQAQGIDTEFVRVLPGLWTAQAYVVTDEDNQQFIVFHPGAAGEAHQQNIADVPPPSLAIVAPNGKDGMIKHCNDLSAQKTPFIFDPGQAIGLFSGDELRACLTQCSYAIVNTGEFNALQQLTDLSADAIIEQAGALLVTHGEEGSEVWTANGEHERTDCVKLGETQDPTGCGDAYRAGLMHGLLQKWNWQKTIRFAAIVAGFKARHNGGQGYDISLEKATDLL